MLMIDADAHVIENESTWECMLESERQFRPKIVGSTNGEASVEYWLIDGRVIPWSNVGKDTPKGSREMSDLSARLKHMDELDVGVQVIYPTFFIFPCTRRPEVDLALCRSYNRWMADIVKKAPDRFNWVVIPPLLSMDRVFEELKFGKENGACGVFMRGLEGDRRLSDPYFFPCMKKLASWICRSAFIRPTGALRCTTSSSMSLAFASSSWQWWAHFTPSFLTASRRDSPS